MNAPGRIEAAESGAAAYRAQVRDATRLSHLFAQAFARDPVFDWLTRTGEARPQALQNFFRWILERHTLSHGESWVAPGGQAAAAWIPPYAQAAPRSLSEDMRVVPAVLRLTGFSRLFRGAAMAAAMEYKPPSESYFYLAFLAVAPRMQGRGLGSSLLERTLARVDAVRGNAYLENSNPRNLRLYERAGFSLIREIRARKDAPPIYAMWRPRRS
jgi:ribosomal protein S18 acetylase RimI-like enzyme